MLVKLCLLIAIFIGGSTIWNQLLATLVPMLRLPLTEIGNIIA